MNIAAIFCLLKSGENFSCAKFLLLFLIISLESLFIEEVK